jgi:hypothetical protein
MPALQIIGYFLMGQSLKKAIAIAKKANVKHFEQSLHNKVKKFFAIEIRLVFSDHLGNTHLFLDKSLVVKAVEVYLYGLLHRDLTSQYLNIYRQKSARTKIHN